MKCPPGFSEFPAQGILLALPVDLSLGVVFNFSKHSLAHAPVIDSARWSGYLIGWYGLPMKYKSWSEDHKRFDSLTMGLHWTVDQLAARQSVLLQPMTTNEPLSSAGSLGRDSECHVPDELISFISASRRGFASWL